MEAKEEVKVKRFNLSFKRIVSRLFLTGIIGIVFGIAMIPFMRVADGLLYQQKASIGGENILRAIALWGVFTAIVTLFTLWKKYLRMVSALLIMCWVISLALGGLLFFGDQSSLGCKRSTPYVLDSEFNRALDLVYQRLDIENHANTYQAAVYAYRNCLDVQYLQEIKDFGAEGMFLAEDPTLQHLIIYINPDYKDYDDLTISTILVHEITHVGQYIQETVNHTQIDCFESEAEAFANQAIFLAQLKNEELRSIRSRLQENVNANPAFIILLGIEDKKTESFNACSQLRSANNLTPIQFNECVWTGTKNKLELEIKADKYYQEQCAHNSTVN